MKGSNGDTVGSSAEIKSVLKRTQTFRVDRSMSSQMHSAAASVQPSGEEGQLPPPSGEGTPTTSPITIGVLPNPEESGSSTTATSIGVPNVKRGSASITTRGVIMGACIYYLFPPF